ncbi:uncharacterized protein VTP21DRAFT_1302 [Calcarisporiella thermophila]|uniref:uncharacterized protein n=1 Tax=Calcarisporiella thermophila TaxID=911321 RepID=UPI00374209B0
MGKEKSTKTSEKSSNKSSSVCPHTGKSPLLCRLCNTKLNTSQPLSAPLPKRIQEKFNRQAAYEEASKEISRWQPIVQENRKKDHLAFPLNRPAPVQISNAGLVSKFEATTALEKEVAEVLKAGGKEDQSAAREAMELELNKMSVEEAQQRRKELRLMRELMFREEARAKRIKKIKSKAYRKIQKKEKMARQLAEMDPEDVANERLKIEAQRAQERMTLRHKSTGKWAKAMLKHGMRDEGTREAVMEQLRRHDELKRKIHDLESDEELSDLEQDEDEVVSDDQQAGEEEEDARQQALRELAELDAEEQAPKKGVFAMKFMQQAESRRRAETQAMLEAFREELEFGGLSDEEEDDEDGEDEEGDETRKKRRKTDNKGAKKDKKLGATVANNPGRMVFGAGNPEDIQRMQREQREAEMEDGENTLELNDAGQITKVASSAAHTTKMSGPVNALAKKATEEAAANEMELAPGEEENPWIQTGSIKPSKGWITGKDDSKSDKLVSKLKKKGKKGQEEQEKEVEIDLEQVLTLNQMAEVAKESKKKKNKNKKKKKEEEEMKIATTTADEGEAADEDTVISPQMGEDEEENETEETLNLVNAKGPLAFTQRELVARAFANDDVVEEFEEEKRQIEMEDAPQETDITLPGWGSWSGKGIKRKAKRVVVKKEAGIEAKKRKDAKLKHVIINEKRVKKADKFHAQKLPHPFQTREQYEQALRAPLGKEWNTNAVFQQMTMPRVTTKAGTIIDPLS